MNIERILQLGYYPVAPTCIDEGAQIVDGQWYMPRWGCNTLQHIADEWPDEAKQCGITICRNHPLST